MRRLPWPPVIGVVFGLALLAFGSPAYATLPGTSWGLSLKMSGAGAKVPTRGTLPCTLTFGQESFSLAPGFSGTFADPADGLKGSLSPAPGELAAFIGDRLEAAGANRGVEVGSVTIGKVTSLLTTKRQWGSLELTLKLTVSYTVSATVDGKSVSGVKGSLTLSGKASNTALGTGSSLAGSEWTVNTTDKIRVHGMGQSESETTQTTCSLSFGPNASEGLVEGEFIQEDEDGYRWGGVYQLDAKQPKVVFDYDSDSLASLMEGLLLDELPGLDVFFPYLEATGSATVKGDTMQFTFALEFSLEGSYYGQDLQLEGSVASKGRGVRLDNVGGALRAAWSNEDAVASPAAVLRLLGARIVKELEGRGSGAH